MKKFSSKISLALAFLFTALFAASPALAKNQSRTTNHPQKIAYYHQQQSNHEHWNNRPNYKPPVKRQRYFTGQHRTVIHKYYTDHYRRGHRPPVHVKNHRHYVHRPYAKSWVIGKPLPPRVVFHELPSSVLVRLGPAPAHHRFVRVAQDVLLLATGTGMVVDAIDNIHWELGH